MKKVLFALVALVGIISSCTNDDITISRAITFKVNPVTVVENLHEKNAGDLTSIDSGDKLQVSLYIYDEKGILVNNVSNDYSAYTHMMTTDIELPAGNYTAVATSHVISSVDFWDFSGLNQLSTFKITDNGYIGGKSKILGLTIKSFSIGNNSETISIDIQNAGAVALVLFSEWNKYNNVIAYGMVGKQACDYVSFDNQGNRDYSIKSESDYNFTMIEFDYDSKYPGAADYFFTFPIRKASYCMYAITTDNKFVPMCYFTDDVLVGETYLFEYDFENDEGSWTSYTKSNSRSLTRGGNLELKKSNGTDHIVYDYVGQNITIQ